MALLDFLMRKSKESISLDEAAQILKTDPELLRKFDEKYQECILSETDSDNLFTINAKQVAEEKEGIEARNCNQNIIDKIVEELISQTSVWKYDGRSVSAEVSRSTTCLLQLLDAVTNDHVIIAATNLMDDVDTAVKRRFTEKHELHRLSAEDNERFIRQYLDDARFSYDLDSVRKYAAENHSQAEIMTHVTRSIASTLINKGELVML